MEFENYLNVGMELEKDFTTKGLKLEIDINIGMELKKDFNIGL